MFRCLSLYVFTLGLDVFGSSSLGLLDFPFFIYSLGGFFGGNGVTFLCVIVSIYDYRYTM